MGSFLNSNTPSTGLEARLASRNNTWDAPTCGIAAGYLQANLIVLPTAYARDFEILCARNPVPCPLLAKSASPGDFTNLISCIPGIADSKIAAGIDIRTDAPRYNVYINGQLKEQGIADTIGIWSEEAHVAFLVGCSYSFETALADAGLIPPHVRHGRNVAMYRTNIPLCPASSFQGGTYVASLRMYHEGDIERVRDVTRPYFQTHGEPIAWGWEGMKALGIADISRPEWGDPPVTSEGHLVSMDDDSRNDKYVPVLWGCGVTPQEAVMQARIPGIVLGHAPGHMIVLDVKEEDVLGKL